MAEAIKRYGFRTAVLARLPYLGLGNVFYSVIR
jgi:hypothetical protein